MKPKQSSTSSSQRTLDSFVKKGEAMKRKNTDENQMRPQLSPVKRAKEGPTTPERPPPQVTPPPSTQPPSVLTPEQKKIMRENQALARLKRLSKSFTLVQPTYIGPDWFLEILEQEFNRPYFKTLDNFYDSACRRTTVYPPSENIFSWTRHCALRSVKVVILGQDPYHGPGQAHGLCFSVQKGISSPPSLQNMYKELVDDPGVPEFSTVPKHGHLVGWAEQGVLLLNAVLTVEASKANSHKDKGWENVTTSVIKWISNNLHNVVFLLWGANAQKMGSVINKSHHHILQTVHPSPLSAHRGFFGCRHFSKCNDLLVKHGKGPIRWEHLP